MKFLDISADVETTYRLKENEQGVFFMHNRSGDLTFELLGPGATAHVFAFCTGRGTNETTLHIHQRHLAPHTTSRVVVKSVLTDEARFSYRGTLHIAKDAPLSDASQENRNLLLSRDAKAFSEPALEILSSDVRCHHAATTSPLNRDTLYALMARGLSQREARDLLVHGFIHSSVDMLKTLVDGEDREKMLSLMEKITL